MMSLLMQPYFWDEAAAHAKLERLVWPEGPVCPHCGGRERIGRVTGKGARAALRFCSDCRKQFRATIGTIFEGSHVPLHKWFQAFFLLTATREGISPHQLHLRIGVTVKTALAITHRFEEAVRTLTGDESAGFPRRRVRWRGTAARQAQPEPGVSASGDFDEVPWANAPGQPSRRHQSFLAAAQEMGFEGDPSRFDRMLAEIAHHRSQYRKRVQEKGPPLKAAV